MPSPSPPFLPPCSLHNSVAEGSSPVKRRTGLGGACSLLAFATVVAVAVLIIADYARMSDVATASLPVYAPVTTSYAAVSPVVVDARLPVSGVSAVNPLTSGLRVAVLAHGPRCAALAWNASNLLAAGGGTMM